MEQPTSSSLNPLLDIIRDRIAEEGSLSVADYMDLCLAHPEHGYYMKHDPFGREGDFVTSPEISQIFGELLGLWCADVWQQMRAIETGALNPLVEQTELQQTASQPVPSARYQDMLLVEMGPGRGTLMKDALRATEKVSGFHDALSVYMIETSPRLANVQYHTLKDAHPRIQWIDRLDQLPPKPLLLIANELFDALPIKQFIQTENGMEERRIIWDEEAGSLAFTSQPQGLQLASDKGGSETLPIGAIIESCPAAREVMGALSSHIKQHGGAAIIIDYGYIGPAQSDTLQAVKAHQFASVLDDPGNADLTAHVSFKALEEVALGQGLRTAGPLHQGEFLRHVGAELRAQLLMKNASPEQSASIISGLQRIIAPEQMGMLFKVLAVTGETDVTLSGF